MKPEFTYRATVVKVIDGDTVDLTIDLGFHLSASIRTRLWGINAPELSTPEGKVTRDRLIMFMMRGTPVHVKTFKDPTDKYGRWLAIIELPGRSETINDWLVRDGLAVPYLP